MILLHNFRYLNGSVSVKHVAVHELVIVGIVLCKWFDDGFHLHPPTHL